MIRVLATGFGPFPGVPRNPTAALMERLAADPPQFGAGVILRTAVIPTVYGGLAAELERLGAAHRPDVAVHFGFAAKAAGFRLEARARNVQATDREDAAGERPADAEIVAGETDRLSTLPLDAIAAALAAAGLPVERSRNCGAYLCNALFFHSAAGLAPGFRPRAVGFVHVPMPGPRAALTAAMLEDGARIVLAETVAHLVRRAQDDAAARRPAARRTARRASDRR